MPETDAPTMTPRGVATTISVCGTPTGVVLVVNGFVDAATSELLREVVRAALVAVKRADRIHLDLTMAEVPEVGTPRIIRQLTRAGARISWAPGRAPLARRRRGGEVTVDA